MPDCDGIYEDWVNEQLGKLPSYEYKEGYDCAISECGRDCPYEDGSIKYRDWQDGYDNEQWDM